MEIHNMTQKNEEVLTKIPSGDAKKDFDVITDFVIEKLKEKDIIDTALFIIDSKNKNIKLIAGDGLPEDGDAKDNIFKNIGKKYAKKMPEADCFIMATEAWASIAEKDEPMIRPFDDPNRVDIVMVTGKMINGEEKYFTKAFQRNEETGEVTFIKRKGLSEFNIDWFDPRKKNDHGAKNNLLNVLWKNFMLEKIINNL